ncbi:Ku protein [Rhizobium sp. L1K21]|uniref:non-homologous end joining protein Ku n=1 Tax=Rhizobium sp. L1K21 TaxID=2954933 RepID=UPI002093DE55|nr:Ku protein [Rhizobium sp. L1K21]MCO6187523.1 Ku protein [Rhizobium sp. L1K21]
MASRTYWKGNLKLSLVTAKVSLTPARTSGNRIRFHILNRETGNRVESRYMDRETHRPVPEKNQVRGYPKPDSDDDFVLLEDHELDAVALESRRTINIEQFVPSNSIAWIWYDRPHFLKPEDELSHEAYGVILQAMARKKVVGIARLVLHGHEHAVLLEPQGKGIVLWTLRYGNTVREPVAQIDRDTKTERKALSALERVILEKTRSWQPSMVKDPLQAKIKKLLSDNTKKMPPKKAARKVPSAKQGNVINITEALRQSLRADKKR